MKRINVRITFLEEVLGTASANEELHATYIASKAPDAIMCLVIGGKDAYDDLP